MTDTVTQRTKDSKALPESWEWSTLSGIGTVASGGTPTTKEPTNFDGDIPWITPADLSGYANKTIAEGRRNLSQKGLDSSSARLLPTGTVIFSSRAPVGYVAIARSPVATNQGCKNLVLTGDVSSDYVYYYLKGSKNLAESYASGTTFLELSARAFGSLPIPLPPLNEQRRIVEKLEELLAKLDAGVRSLEQARAQLKSYRRSVLKAAVEGELSREWREAHKNELEPAAELLERILRERREKWESQQLRQLQAKGKVPTNDKWKAKYRAPELLNEAELPDLPEGWARSSLQQLARHIVDGTHRTPQYKDEGIPFISAKDINGFQVYFDNCRFISEEEHEQLIKRCFPTKGDVLVTKSGTIGRTAVVKTEEPFSLFESVALIPVLDPVVPAFIAFVIYLSSTGQFGAKHGKGIAVKHLHLEDLRRLPVPLPPFEEQTYIVEEVERRLSVVDKLEATVEENLKQANALRQSILKRAFSGELVPQDPNDEPASALLERIREEREAAKPKSSKRGGGAKRQVPAGEWVPELFPRQGG